MKKCPKCNTNFIADSDEICSLCRTEEPTRQTHYLSKDKFYIINKQTYHANRQGYLIFDEQDRNVGIVFMTDDKRASSYGNAEIKFFDGYRREFGVWRRIKINGAGLLFTHLKNLLEKYQRFDCLLDPRR